MSSNKDYYYLKNELNSIKFILIVIILLFIHLFFFFLQKNIFHHTFESLVESGFLGVRQQSGVGSGFAQQIVCIRVRHLVTLNSMVDPWQCHGMLRGKSLNSSCHLQGCQLKA